jgi:hypothetical protein
MGEREIFLGAVERPDNRVSKAREISERANDSLIRDWARVGDSYLKGHINIAIRRVTSSDRKYGVLFESIPPRDELQTLFQRRRANSDHLGNGICSKQTPVFPRQVECVKYEEKIVPAIVRLEIFNSQLIGNGQPLYLFYRPVRGIIEGGGILPDGEVDIFWTDCAVASRKSHGKNVQTTPYAVYDDACLRVEQPWERLHVAEADNLLRGISIEISEQRIGLVIEPNVNALLKNWEIGYGPINSSFGV